MSLNEMVSSAVCDKFVTSVTHVRWNEANPVFVTSVTLTLGECHERTKSNLFGDRILEKILPFGSNQTSVIRCLFFIFSLLAGFQLHHGFLIFKSFSIKKGN